MNSHSTASRAVLLLVALLSATVLSGCKLVIQSPDQQAEIPAGAEGDDARTAIRIAETFESQLLPHIADAAVPTQILRDVLSGSLEAAGEEHGNRGAGQGAAWNFAVSGSGTVVETKLDTRARSIAVDTDSDGIADTTLQLGPVMRGTSVRDFAPFYNFDDFRDQIEFAKLGRAINDELASRLSRIESVAIGDAVKFTGVVALKTASEAWIVTPTTAEILQ